MNVLEACKKTTRDQRSNRRARWNGIFDVVQGFSAEVWKEVRLRLTADGGDGGYLPSSDEILECCEEVRDESKPAVLLKPVAAVAPHICAKDRKPRNSTAAMIAGLNPYEGEHLYCQGDIPATCPLCGVRHFEDGVFAGFFKARGESMEGVNDCFKGHLICDACAKKS